MSAYEALQALSGDLARLHWEHAAKLAAAATASEAGVELAQRSFKDAPPALYLLPSGRGGVQTQACGLFVVQGVNSLLGGAYAQRGQPPQWWHLVRSLDRLDVALLPDWSAASIHSYAFLTRHLLASASDSYAAHWLGCVFSPALAEAGVESPLLLTPPTTAPAEAGRLRHLPATNPEKCRLFYKIGVGELCLHSLGTNVGVLLVWHPAGKKTAATTATAASHLSVFLPVAQPSEPGVSPTALLAGILRALRKVPELLAAPEASAAAAEPLKRTTTVPAAAHAKPMSNGTPATARPHVK